jgi:hypothetical protein
MAMRQWNISIVETNDSVEAVITNMETGESLTLEPCKFADFDNDRDEAIGELFSGSGPNIRDSFDTV